MRQRVVVSVAVDGVAVAASVVAASARRKARAMVKRERRAKTVRKAMRRSRKEADKGEDVLIMVTVDTTQDRTSTVDVVAARGASPSRREKRMARAMEKSVKSAKEVVVAHRTAGTPVITTHQDTTAHLAHSDSHDEDGGDSVDVEGVVVVAVDGDVAAETTTTPRRERERSPNPLEKRADKPPEKTLKKARPAFRVRKRERTEDRTSDEDGHA